MRLYAVRMKSNYFDTNENGNSSEYYIVERSGESDMDEELELEALMNDDNYGTGLVPNHFQIRNTTLDKAILEGTEDIKEFLVDRLLRGHIRVRYQ